MMKYKSIIVTKRGGLDGVDIIEKDLHLPLPGEARIRILAAPVVQDDVAARVGNRPFLPKLPFVPGYAALGIVDAIGEGVTDVVVGDRVAAMTNFGSHAEMLYWQAHELVHVPDTLDPGKAVTLILNYLVAYQVLHRVAAVKPEDKVLIVGASGGCGTAFLQLGALANLKMYGLASAGKHQILQEYGAIPIDYRAQDFVSVLQQVEPNGIDYVFNGMGDDYFERGLRVLREGGMLVHYGGPESLTRLLLLIVKLALYNILPNGKKIEGYGTHRLGVELFKEDWTTLFELLEQNKINPIIAENLPLLEAKKAYAMLENGQVVGNIVLLAPELL